MTSIAFVGLGAMGAPMAENLVKRQFRVTGFDMRESARTALMAAGGQAAESAAAAAKGAQVILIQELFEAPYFCIEERAEYLRLARPAEGHPLIGLFQSLAKELGVVLPCSFFEKAGQAHFNSAAMIDADGRALGIYRKSHIPQGPGYASAGISGSPRRRGPWR